MSPLVLAAFFALWGTLCFVVLALRHGLEWVARRVVRAAPPDSVWGARPFPRLARFPA